MSKLKEKLIEAQRKNEAILLDENKKSKSRKEYIENAVEGLIVAFRINFTSKKSIPLKKTISGKIISNNKEENVLVVETRNSLQYAVPYDSVIWVKTGERWPKGVYAEMKQGSVAVDSDEDIDEISLIEDSVFDTDEEEYQENE